MNVLAVQSSTQACSVSLRIGQRSFTEFKMAPQQHANLILPMVNAVLEQAQCDEKSIDVLAFSEGPGAFTGVRIAAGVVQGLAFGWQKPVQAVSSLEAMAWQAYQDHGEIEWAALLDARMHEVYLQVCRIQSEKLVSEPPQLLSEAATLEQLEASRIKQGVGDIQTVYPQLTARFNLWVDLYPSAEAVAIIAQQRSKASYDLSEKLPMPVYLRNNVADKPKAKRNKLL